MADRWDFAGKARNVDVSSFCDCSPSVSFKNV